MAAFATIAAVSYLLGSIPFGYVLMRLFRGQDVRQTGSGNIGATNVARSSPGLGLATLALDAGKGWLAVVLSPLFCPGQLQRPGATAFCMALAALGALAGHIFPIWLKFRGGKGVATAAGSFAVLAPDAMLVVFGVFLLLVMLFRYVSLGSVVAVAVFPVAAYLLHRHALPASAYALMGIGSALIIGRHHANIRRLLAGTESRLRFGRSKESA